MLVENLDGKEDSNPRIHSTWPGPSTTGRSPITASPVFTPTEVAFTAEIEANNAANVLPETRLFADDLQSIVRGLTIEIAVNINKYYPGKGFRSRGQSGMRKYSPSRSTLHLIKRGARSSTSKPDIPIMKKTYLLLAALLLATGLAAQNPTAYFMEG